MKKTIIGIGAALLVLLTGFVSYSYSNNSPKPSEMSVNKTERSTDKKTNKWEEISSEGVDEELLLKNMDSKSLEKVNKELDLVLENRTDEALLSSGISDITNDENYKQIIAMGKYAEKPLYYLIYKSKDAGLKEYICAYALSEISGYNFSNSDGSLKWSNAKEFLDLFNQKVTE